jgi:hypothetical protein
MKNKILILILSTKDKSYHNFIQNSCNTWVANARKNGFRCIFYSGGAGVDKLENDNLELSCDDTLQGTAFKLFRALEFIESNGIEYTHIFRTNLSSFIFIDDFISYCKSLELNFYGGVIGKYNKIKILNRSHYLSILSAKLFRFQTIPYASGSGFFISKDLVSKILINKNILNFNYIDDVMVGNALLGNKIKFISRFDISDEIQKSPFHKNCFHVRLKSKNRVVDAQRLNLLFKHSNLHSFIESLP